MNVAGWRPAVGVLLGAALGLAATVPALGFQASSATTYAPLPLVQAPLARTTFYTAPTSAVLTPSGIPFSLANTYWLRYGDAPVSLSMNYEKPLAVYLLLNTSWTNAYFAGQTVGVVRLSFSDGSTRTTPLVVGANIREWEYGVSWTVRTLSNPSTVSVWQGQAQAWAGGAAATMDMIPVDATSTTARLTGVTVSITYNSHMGILYQGLTVAYDPWHRPGHSWDTPAAVNSQAPMHAQSANFTGLSPAQDPSAEESHKPKASRRT